MLLLVLNCLPSLAPPLENVIKDIIERCVLHIVSRIVVMLGAGIGVLIAYVSL